MPRLARAQDPIKIAFSVPGLNFPFFVHMMDLAKRTSSRTPRIRIHPARRPGGRRAELDQAVDRHRGDHRPGCPGLVISPNDVDALAPAIQAALDAGMVVVTVDRNVTDVTTLAHVGADNVEGGRIQGRYLLEILPEGGDVIELQGQPGASPAIDRHAGLDEIIAGAGSGQDRRQPDRELRPREGGYRD